MKVGEHYLASFELIQVGNRYNKETRAISEAKVKDEDVKDES
jgi:hypothetical protein